MKGPAFVVLAVLLGAHGALAQLNVLAKLAGKQYFGSAVDNPALSDVPYRKQLSNWLDFGQLTAVRVFLLVFDPVNACLPVPCS